MRLRDHVVHQIVAYLSMNVDGTEHGRDGYEKGPHDFEDMPVGGKNLAEAIAPG